MTFRTQDGTILTNTAPPGIVAELHKLSHTQYATDVEFMYQMAARAALQTGKRISAANADEFVASLVSVGLLIDEDKE